MKRVSIGIDPGITGAIAAIDASSLALIELVDTPTIMSAGKRIYDVSEMAAVIRHMSLLGDALVVLEQAQPMPGQGVTSTFSTGRSFGLWEGLLGALDVPFRTARPIVWTKRVFAGVSGEGKARSIQFSLRMFPGIELTPAGCKAPRDGRADAACLAYYGTLA